MSGYVLLEDGTRFEGEMCGAEGASAVGEVVFNTSMTGYQEAVTDPSYAGQLITFTYPMIGNYGVAEQAMESDRIHARAAIMRDARNSEDAATAERGWLDWLRDCGIPAITGVDTRALVRHIRDAGAMRGGVFGAETSQDDARELIAAEPSMAGADFASQVSPDAPVEIDGDGPHVVALDTGIKLSIVRQFRERGAKVTLLPCATGADEVMARDPDLVFLANGPGDPAARRPGRRDGARDRRQEARRRHLPRPSAPLPRGRPRHLQAPLRPPRRQPPGQGARHRPDRDHLAEPRLRRRRFPTAARRSTPTSRSAGTPTSAPPSSRTSTSTTARSKGLVLKDVPARTVQYHPEAGPGPHDARHLFDEFLEMAA